MTNEGKAVGPAARSITTVFLASGFSTDVEVVREETGAVRVDIRDERDRLVSSLYFESPEAGRELASVLDRAWREGARARHAQTLAGGLS